MSIFKRIAMVLLSAGMASGTVVTAEEQHGDWIMHVQDSPKECYTAAKHQSTKSTKKGKDVTKEVKRGEILLYTTYKPSENISGLVSFTGGYPFAPDSTVSVQIGDDKFDMFVSGEWAWPNAKDDARLMAAMKKGARAVLTARSARGTQTQDTFSLSGYTAATDAARSACGG